MIPFIFTCKITYLAGNEHNCGLSFPARYYAEVTPVLSSLLFVTIALTRTVVVKNQQVQISISPPLPLLPFDRRPPPWYKFLSLLMALAFRCCKKKKQDDSFDFHQENTEHPLAKITTALQASQDNFATRHMICKFP